MTDAWQPIASAPKDGTRILAVYRTNIGLVVRSAYWEADKYGKKPNPFWAGEMADVWGKVTARKNPPTHWQPWPAPPTDRSK